MKRLPALAALAAVSVLTAPHAVAASKPKPVTTTYYAHGAQPLGDVDQRPVGGTLLSMDAKHPAGSSAKNFVLYGALASPNSQCAGNALFPNWVGAATGTLTGKVTVRFYAQSTPGASVTVQVFGDVTSQACNADFPGAFGEVVVPVPASPSATLVTAVVPLSGKTNVFGTFDVQIQPGRTAGLPSPQVTNVAYDGTTAPTSVTWTCLPKPGRKTC